MVGHAKKTSMLTVKQVARLLNIHVNTVRRWSNRGPIRAYRIGSRRDRRFRREDIASFLFSANRERRTKQAGC